MITYFAIKHVTGAIFFFFGLNICNIKVLKLDFKILAFVNGLLL